MCVCPCQKNACLLIVSNKTDWLTDRPTDRPTDQPTNRPINRPTVWLTGLTELTRLTRLTGLARLLRLTRLTGLTGLIGLTGLVRFTRLARLTRFTRLTDSQKDKRQYLLKCYITVIFKISCTISCWIEISWWRWSQLFVALYKVVAVQYLV